LKSGNKEAILHFLWETIKIGIHKDLLECSAVRKILSERSGEDVGDIRDSWGPDNILLGWASHHLENSSYGREVKNYKEFSNPDLFIYLFSSALNTSTDACKISDEKEKINALINISKQNNIPQVITAAGLTSGNERMIVHLLGYTFRKCYPN
jgi:hypothetical protein